jgi:hypothetical protein
MGSKRGKMSTMKNELLKIRELSKRVTESGIVKKAQKPALLTTYSVVTLLGLAILNRGLNNLAWHKYFAQESSAQNIIIEEENPADYETIRPPRPKLSPRPMLTLDQIEDPNFPVPSDWNPTVMSNFD